MSMKTETAHVSWVINYIRGTKSNSIL